MPREKESYRDNLEWLLREFPDKKLVTISDVVNWSKRDHRTVRRLYFKDGETFVTLPVLARRMS